MSDTERFDTWRQRQVLTSIADLGGKFFNTAEGAAFIEQLHTYFASCLTGTAKSWGFHVEPDEVVNLIIDRLLSSRTDPERCPARYAAAAEKPWSYLHTCAQRWLQDLYGLRGVPLEYAENVPHADHSDPDRPTLDEVVDLTFGLVSTVIANRYHREVFELLKWLASNPPQRLSYDRDDRVAAHRFCPSLSIDQVAAVFKIARGSRPRERETSLMGQFLENAEFDLCNSGSHARALVHFKNEFRAGEDRSRMLSDWAKK